jgi:hypothetical protein
MTQVVVVGITVMPVVEPQNLETLCAKAGDGIEDFLST